MVELPDFSPESTFIDYSASHTKEYGKIRSGTTVVLRDLGFEHREAASDSLHVFSKLSEGK
jgi:hypothetical protein